MSLLLIEGALAELETQLTANMGAKLTALNTAYGDGITLAAIKAYYIGEQQQIPEYPAIVLEGPDSDIEDYSTTDLGAMHKITSTTVVTGTVTETLARRAMRHNRAVIETIMECHAAGAFSWTLSIDSCSFSSTYTNVATKTFMRGAAVFLTMSKREIK